MTIRDLLETEAPVFAPLCLDALSARLAQRAGFKCGYVSGGALGYAHAVSEALLSLDELADVVRHVCARSDLYMIVDGGVGFGDAVHLTRAVKVLESAGAAAIEIEDQVAPKRVSHHRGIEHLIPPAEMAAKIKYAVDARTDEATLIIARTGAVKNESLARACERADAYVEAGADAILLMPESAEQWAAVASKIDAPIVSFGALGARKPAQWAEQGVSLVIDPFSVQVMHVRATQQAYADFFADRDPQLSLQELFATYNELDELAGFAELYAIEDATTLVE